MDGDDRVKARFRVFRHGNSLVSFDRDFADFQDLTSFSSTISTDSS
jgi:hypothetical protein